ncbi:MAG: response regulator transcription factor [Gammaproteobacteria bacterium]|nr:response regulator transcription factor [Gammaproteobacteria bacterium]
MIKVYVVDDQTLIREGICALLSYSDNIQVMGSASSGKEALDSIHLDPPDVLLMDVRMPGMSGIDTLQAINGLKQNIPVILLTTFDEPQLIIKGLQAGARGYLLKDVSLDQLSSAIETVVNGGVVLHPDVNQQLLPQLALYGKELENKTLCEQLTLRETEILKLMARGLGNQEIADIVHLAVGTIKNHVSSIYQKLSVDSRTQAVITAATQGLLDS